MQKQDRMRENYRHWYYGIKWSCAKKKVLK